MVYKVGFQIVGLAHGEYMAEFDSECGSRNDAQNRMLSEISDLFAVSPNAIVVKYIRAEGE